MFFFLLIKAQESKVRLAHGLCPPGSSVSEPETHAWLLQPLSPLNLLAGGCFGQEASSPLHNSVKERRARN